MDSFELDVQTPKVKGWKNFGRSWTTGEGGGLENRTIFVGRYKCFVLKEVRKAIMTL